MKSRIAIALIVVVAIVLAIVVVWRRDGLPGPGSEAYEQVTRAFYHGLAALEVGLLDDARMQFTRATEIVPEEPASWANLAVAQLRLGELEAAAEPVARALSLASDHPELALLAARAELAQGRLDEGVAYLRRAAELDPEGLKTRFALAEEIERSGVPNADAEALALLDQLVELAPENPAILLERGRLAARAGDAARLNDSTKRLTAIAAGWPEAVQEQLRALQSAAAASDFAVAGRSTILMRNLLTAVPSFRESLAAVRTPTELVAEALDRFVRLAPPRATPSPPDETLRFEAQAVADAPSGDVVLAVPSTETSPPLLFTADGSQLRRAGAPGNWPLPPNAGTLSAASLVAVDWNNDFRTDVVTATSGGVQLFLQDEAGAFAENTPPVQPPACGCFGAWPADIEMDGDLDIVVARNEGAPVVLRNNGDGTWMPVEIFGGVEGVRGFAWADLDLDADPDAVLLDQEGRLHVFANRQAGEFVRIPDFPEMSGALAVAAADLDADGVFEIVTLHEGGALRATARPGESWQTRDLAEWTGFQNGAPGRYRLHAADVDNNGAVDLIASGPEQSGVWLSDEEHNLAPLASVPEGVIVAASDVNGDGRVDLIAQAGAASAAAGAVIQLINRGTADYHWKVIRPRATTTTGDQRINSFGVGGDIQVRSGLLVQKQLLTGGPVHVGLGEHATIDVARVLWPNGVAQAEFGLEVDDELVAEQRLKGSCPWVFAWDGTTMGFVTDFLWRSPLGLRINARDTAGVVQTEDWIRISGDQLAPRDGAYDIRITAELWETHFFDHVSLLTVDHARGTEVYVDERFSAAHPPAYAIHAVRDMQPVQDARDHRGRDVTDLVASRDGRYLATFHRGRYQGVAEEHSVEFAVGPRGHGLLIASGWIYPTDSSINVAIGQGSGVRPGGLTLEAEDGDGRWRVIEADLGFPAGKNKTMVIDVTRAGAARRLRLRTNLEIYWDALSFAAASDAPLRVTRLDAASAELRFRGFSETTSPRGEAPEVPDYDRLAGRAPRWRDLEGYHTRFGDVRELLTAVDDRYVIMNAGDEMRLRFPAREAPAAGWRRDFVLIGDGWEKDGDYNTGFSQTVLPLPSHDTPDYGRGVTSLALEDDPVYRRHRGDWETYHTRYVAPAAFVKGLFRW